MGTEREQLKQLDKEYIKCLMKGNVNIAKHIDIYSKKDILLKIKVLRAINQGIPLKKIPNYEKVIHIPEGVWD